MSYEWLNLGSLQSDFSNDLVFGDEIVRDCPSVKASLLCTLYARPWHWLHFDEG